MANNPVVTGCAISLHFNLSFETLALLLDTTVDEVIEYWENDELWAGITSIVEPEELLSKAYGEIEIHIGGGRTDL